MPPEINLALVLDQEGYYAEAEKLDRETLDIRRRVLGPEHPDTLRSLGTLGGVLTDEGHYPEAEKLHREALDVQQRVLGPEHPDTAITTARAIRAWIKTLTSNRSTETRASTLSSPTRKSAPAATQKPK